MRFGMRTKTYPTTSLSDQSYGAASIRKYDVYYPTGATAPSLSTLPILIYAHGSAWGTGGDKAEGTIPAMMAKIASYGWVVYSINYSTYVSMGNAASCTQSFKDGKAFLGYLGEGSGYGDTTKISVFGISTGGHFVQMMAFTAKATNSDSEHPSTNWTIVAAVPTQGPEDFNSLYPITIAQGQTGVQHCLGYVPSTDPTNAYIASPENYVSASPPWTLLRTSSLDTFIPPAQITDLQSAFVSAGATNTSVINYTGLIHGDPALTDITSQPFLDLLAFIEGHGR
jgi:acetyl esterase/lipase